MYRLDHAGKAGPMIETRSTRRPPGNVPYLVDNLWEWRRPAVFPNRRHAVYAAPTPELTLPAGGEENGEVYLVEVSDETSRLCQSQVCDARDHPDVKILPKFINQLLGSAWINAPLQVKKGISPLWAPCLMADEVEELFATDLLNPFRQEVWEKIGFWDQVQLFESFGDLPFENGEIFFEATKYVFHSIREKT